MRLTRRTALIIAAGCALAAAGLGWIWIGQVRSRPATASPQIVQVPVPVKTIPARIELQSDMFRQMPCDRNTLPPNCVLTQGDLTGRIALTELAAEKPVTGEQVTRHGEHPGLAFSLPAGQRAVALSVDLIQAVGDFVQPGNYVDVLVAWNKDGHYQVRTLVQNVLVLAMGTSTKPGTPPPAATSATGTATETASTDKGAGGRRGEIACVLSATPSQAQSILLADVSGTVRFALRGLDDKGTATVSPTNSWDVIGAFPQSRSSATAPPPVPAPAPAAPAVCPPQPAPNGTPQVARPTSQSSEGAVEVVRGEQHEVVTPGR